VRGKLNSYEKESNKGLITIFIKIKAHRGDPLNEQADRGADEGRQSESICWSLPSNRPIFYWTDNSTTHRSPMNPTVKKRINLQVSQQQLKIHAANFLIREDSSRDLLGKFHKDSILNDVKCSLCEKYYKERNIPEPPDTVESVGHIRCYCPALQLPQISIHHGI